MMEIWRDIDSYEGLYQISNKGRVKSLKYGKERILRAHDNGDGYLKVQLYKNTARQYRYIHRLVAETFIANQHNLPEINHKDENKKNNRVENLEWMTSKENNNYGTRNERVGDSQSKPIFQYSKSGDFIREWQSAVEVKRVLGIDQGNIAHCCRGNPKHTTAGGFVWKYKEKD